MKPLFPVRRGRHRPPRAAAIRGRRLGRAADGAGRAPGGAGALRAAARSASRGGISGRVHPLRRLRAGLPRARDRHGGGRRRARGGHAAARAGPRALHRLSRHAVRAGLSDAGSHGAGRWLVGLPARGAGVPSRALHHLPRHGVPRLRGQLPGRCGGADHRRHRPPGAAPGRLRRMRSLRAGLRHPARRRSPSITRRPDVRRAVPGGEAVGI